jgi:hypothetical protein
MVFRSERSHVRPDGGRFRSGRNREPSRCQGLGYQTRRLRASCFIFLSMLVRAAASTTVRSVPFPRAGSSIRCRVVPPRSRPCARIALPLGGGKADFRAVGMGVSGVEAQRRCDAGLVCSGCRLVRSPIQVSRVRDGRQSPPPFLSVWCETSGFLEVPGELPRRVVDPCSSRMLGVIPRMWTRRVSCSMMSSVSSE